MGIPKEEMYGHGFRAPARTIIRQELHIREDLIEHELGHASSASSAKSVSDTHLESFPAACEARCFLQKCDLQLQT